jgi:hypothetical protein
MFGPFRKARELSPVELERERCIDTIIDNLRKLHY